MSIPSDLRSCFWDTSFETLDPVKHRDFIIGRLLRLGSPDAWRWLRSTYDQPEIIHVVKTDRELKPKDVNFYSIIFNLKPEEAIWRQSASTRDLTCMKMESISSRGVKRDFIDLYFLHHNNPLDMAFQWFEEKYGGHNISKTHVLKSLIYFTDAEADPMPRMLKPIEWDQVKSYFNQVVPELAHAWGI